MPTGRSPASGTWRCSTPDSSSATTACCRAFEGTSTPSATGNFTLNQNNPNNGVSALQMMGGTLSMSGGGQIVLGANVYTYGAATLATIDAPINLNNASRTFTLSQGTPLYAAVEGSSGSSVGQLVAGRPAGPVDPGRRRRDGPGRRQHPTDPKQRGPGTLCRQQRHFVLLAVQRADHRLDRQLHDVQRPNVYQTAQAIQTQLQTWSVPATCWSPARSAAPARLRHPVAVPGHFRRPGCRDLRGPRPVDHPHRHQHHRGMHDRLPLPVLRRKLDHQLQRHGKPHDRGRRPGIGRRPLSAWSRGWSA